MMTVEMNSKDGKFSNGGSEGSSSMPSKKPIPKGPLDMFFSPNPASIVTLERMGGKKTLNELCRKELREKACADNPSWFYDNPSWFYA